MKLHELKIKNEYWVYVHQGLKTFELRKNDRDYQVGDLINFKVIASNYEIQDKDVYQITYILKDVKEYGLNEEYCILGIKKLTLEGAKSC